MPDYRRNYIPGGTYFFTVVTGQRRPILDTPLARQLLHEALAETKARFPFELFAIVLLPDHLHTIWTLPPNDSDYSNRWRMVKEQFTRHFLASGGGEAARSQSRLRHRERAVWQRRFWEHTCRDEEDLKRSLDYVHWNPVKHGLVARVRDFQWSSFHRFVKLGEYDQEWGEANPCPGWDEPEWE
jgi:putative transposase